MHQNGLESGKAVDATSENVHYFDFWVSCLYTFNPLSLSLKWVMILVPTIYRNMEKNGTRFFSAGFFIFQTILLWRRGYVSHF